MTEKGATVKEALEGSKGWLSRVKEVLKADPNAAENYWITRDDYGMGTIRLAELIAREMGTLECIVKEPEWRGDYVHGGAYVRCKKSDVSHSQQSRLLVWTKEKEHVTKEDVLTSGLAASSIALRTCIFRFVSAGDLDAIEELIKGSEEIVFTPEEDNLVDINKYLERASRGKDQARNLPKFDDALQHKIQQHNSPFCGMYLAHIPAAERQEIWGDHYLFSQLTDEDRAAFYALFGHEGGAE